MSTDESKTIATALSELTTTVGGMSTVLAELKENVIGFRREMDERDKRYIQASEATDAKTALALTANEKAVAKAELAVEKRFDLIREESQTSARTQNEKIESLKTVQDVSGGNTKGVNATWALIIIIAGLAIAVVTLILKK